MLAVAEVPYEFAAKKYGVSRAYYYELKIHVRPVLELMFGFGDSPSLFIMVTRSFIERCVMALSMYCRAPIEGIVSFFDQVIGYHVSKGKVWEIHKRAIEKAKELDSNISLTGIEAVAMDEIFQHKTPILTAIDLKTGYIPLMEPVKDRTSDTWTRKLEQKKELGLEPCLNISDAGVGLLKGIPGAFPEIDMQPDIFHCIRDLGVEVNKIDRNALSHLSQLYDYEERLKGKRIHQGTLAKYYTLKNKTPEILSKADTVEILFSWLREHIGFTGYGYGKSLELCNWILDEMATLYPEKEQFQKAILTFRKMLPKILGFLLRLQEKMDQAASSFLVSKDDFSLLYHQTVYPPESREYEQLEMRLYRKFKKRLPEAREALATMIKTTYRASSLVENLNGRLRNYINLKRIIPDDFFALIQFFLNTKKALRSRKEEWRGTSALERLTGRKCPEFLELLFGPIDYVA